MGYIGYMQMWFHFWDIILEDLERVWSLHGYTAPQLDDTMFISRLPTGLHHNNQQRRGGLEDSVKVITTSQIWTMRSVKGTDSSTLQFIVNKWTKSRDVDQSVFEMKWRTGYATYNKVVRWETLVVTREDPAVEMLMVFLKGTNEGFLYFIQERIAEK